MGQARIVEVAQYGGVACPLHGELVMGPAPQLQLPFMAPATGGCANKVSQGRGGRDMRS